MVRGDLDKPLRSLQHRGPDASGTWISADSHVALGHARLSIIDLVTGQQPIPNEDGSVHAVVAGELYGFEDIRAEMENLGHRFRSRSDSEIAVHLYEEFEIDFLSRVHGEFALVLWDEPKQRLVAARDRFGIKPLFYSHHRDRLILASEVKALHAAGVDSAWNDQAFFEKLTLDHTLNGETLFRHVQEIPPGCFLIADSRGLRLRRYWDWNFPAHQLSGDELHQDRWDEQYAEQLCYLLNQAVRSRMHADVPVGCYLSGGIDSSAVLGLMSRHASKPVPAFTITFPDPQYDEHSAALTVATHFGADLNTIAVTQSGIATDFSDAVWHAETVFSNAHTVAKFALSRAARNAGIRVVLTGEGADEILGGYAFFVKDSIRNGTPSGHEVLRNSLGLSETQFRDLLAPQCPAAVTTAFHERLGYVPAWVEWRELIARDIRLSLGNAPESVDVYARLLDGLDIAGQLDGRPVLNKSLYLYGKTALPGYVLTVLGDRMEMAHSIEGRLPFLDSRVVEFAQGLPVSQKIRGTAEKFVLRKAMRGVLPPAQCARRKQAFQAPPALLHPGEPLHNLMQDTLRSRVVDRVPFVERAKLIQMLDSGVELDQNRKTIRDMSLMLILSACVLVERFRL